MTAPKTLTLGPGSLIFGETGSPKEFAQQVLECSVEFGTDSTDDVDVLSGGIVAGSDTFTASLKFEVFQDISATGINTYALDHRGELLPFTFVPSTTEAREVTGVVKVRPINIGGKAKEKATASAEWPCVGVPTLETVMP